MKLSKSQWQAIGKETGWIKTAQVARESLEKGLQTFRPSAESLKQLTDQYESYWSYGVSPDPVLEDMLRFSGEIAEQARNLLNKLNEKMASWDAEAKNR